jgi:hypothetical protein
VTGTVALTVLLATAAPPDAHEAARLREQAKAAMLASPRIAPVSAPERVEVLPVEDMLDELKPGESASDLGLAAHFRVIEKPRSLDTHTRAELRRILMNPRSYSSAVSACTFQPFVAFRHWAAGVFVDVLVGPRCSQVAFAENGRDLLGYLLLTNQAAGKLQALVARSRLRE